jgi:hypothetical protein
MAKNTGRGSRVGSVTGRTKLASANGVWIKRDTASGQFMEAKKSGGSFKGVKGEK